MFLFWFMQNNYHSDDVIVLLIWDQDLYNWNEWLQSIYQEPVSDVSLFGYPGKLSLCRCTYVNLNIKCRFAKFLYKAINSQNERIAFLAKLCM